MATEPDPQLYRRRRIRALIIIAITIVVTVVGLAALRFTKPEKAKPEPVDKALRVQTQTVVLRNLAPSLSLVGRVESPTRVRFSAPVAAEVKSVPSRAGQVVAIDTPLLALDTADLRLQLQQRQAELDDARAQLKLEAQRVQADRKALAHEQQLVALAQQDLQRQQSLRQRKVIAPGQVDQAARVLAQQQLALVNRELVIAQQGPRKARLQATVKRATAARDKARLDLQRAQIKAPSNGLVAAVHVAAGDRVQPGQQLLDFYDPASAELRAQIPERQLSAVRAALTAGVQLKATAVVDGQTLALDLLRLAAVANRGTGGVDAYFKPSTNTESLSRLLTSGQVVSLALQLPEIAGVVAVPTPAIYGQQRVYRLVDGRMRPVQVQLLGNWQGLESGRPLQLVRGNDLKVGDELIVTQLPNALDGLEVKVAKELSAEPGNESKDEKRAKP